MAKKKRKRIPFSKNISSKSTGTIPALVVVIMHIAIIEIVVLFTLYYSIDDQFLSLYVFIATGILNEFSSLLKE